MRYLLLFVSIISLSCTNNDMTPSVPLKGKWVEKANKMDTIIFDPELNGDKYFIFKSTKGISGYHNHYSTIYEYNINGDKISIYNTISSCYCFSNYSFTQTDDKIFIENFYDSNSQGVVEIFEKLN